MFLYCFAYVCSFEIFGENLVQYNLRKSGGKLIFLEFELPLLIFCYVVMNRPYHEGTQNTLYKIDIGLASVQQVKK